MSLFLLPIAQLIGWAFAINFASSPGYILGNDQITSIPPSQTVPRKSNTCMCAECQKSRNTFARNAA